MGLHALVGSAVLYHTYDLGLTFQLGMAGPVRGNDL